MNILVLGGTGMLGHKIFQYLHDRKQDVSCTVRGGAEETLALAPGLFRNGNIIYRTDVLDWAALERLLILRRPGMIVNCVGVIKQREEAKAAVPSITINALLPHRLAELCRQWGGRLVHFSTDCVFSGERGNYTEEDNSDAHDLYGRTKFLGEVSASNALTLRTSIIGRELTHYQSLLEWFLGQNGRRVKGYTRAFYSGVTTNYMAELVTRIIEEFPSLSGIYHVTGVTTSKFDLLCLLRDAFGIDVEIEPDEEFFCDRSMKGSKFREATGYHCPPWNELVAQLARDITPYEEWRRNVPQAI